MMSLRRLVGCGDKGALAGSVGRAIATRRAEDIGQAEGV